MQDVPASARRALRRHLLDGVGNALAASRLRVVPFATALIDPQQHGNASLIDGDHADAASAAFTNAVYLHALDYDDTHADSLVHPTAVVLPTALAIAEETAASTEEFILACVAGYELVTRLGIAARHGFHARGFHATSVCGVFASAVVAARLLRFSERSAVNALGIAGSFASGSLEFLNEGSTTKQIQPAWACLAGINAARLAAAGATGSSTVLEGSYGLFRAYTDAHVEPETLFADLGHTWQLERITIKPYPACQLMHPALDCISLLRPMIPDTEKVQAITCELPTESAAIVCEPKEHKLKPRTAYEAKFSLQWSASALLLDGALTVDTYDETNVVSRRDILGLAKRVQFKGYESTVAAASSPSRVRIDLSDGTTFNTTVDASRGSPANPLSDEALIDKFRANVGDPTRAAHIAAQIDNIEELAGTTELLSALRRRNESSVAKAGA